MKFRDIELLSTYLDGQLSPSESARLESRISSDANLRAILDDLREARGLLRRLPARKAPRNFTVTREMVGLKPPLPRAYPTFRFATALATLLLFATFAINALSPSLARTAAAPLPSACEACGGGPALEAQATELFAATEPPAATEAPVEPSLAMIPTATPLAAADSARQSETPTEESGVMNLPQQPPAPSAAVIPVTWQVALALLAVLSGLAAFLIRRAAMQKWK